MARFAKILTSSCVLLAAACAPQEEIGASLNNKSDVTIGDVPPAVLVAAKAMRPDIDFTEAERETRNGVIYYDVGGENADGEETELDIMQDGEGWRVVEIQRDIALADTPAPVLEALFAEAPEIAPARIIESDQTDGVIIYEFFTLDADGSEKKYEVRYENGEADFLAEEWVH